MDWVASGSLCCKGIPYRSSCLIITFIYFFEAHQTKNHCNFFLESCLQESYLIEELLANWSSVVQTIWLSVETCQCNNVFLFTVFLFTITHLSRSPAEIIWLFASEYFLFCWPYCMMWSYKNRKKSNINHHYHQNNNTEHFNVLNKYFGILTHSILTVLWGRSYY